VSVGDLAVSIRKEFDKNCSSFLTTMVQSKADYTLSMKPAGFFTMTCELEDKEGNKILQTKGAHTGGTLAKQACDAIAADWAKKNGTPLVEMWKMAAVDSEGKAEPVPAPPPDPTIVVLPSDPKDYKQFVDSNRSAAEQGDAKAQYALGLAYANGYGVPHDNAEAFFWIDLASKNGYTKGEQVRSVIGTRLKATDHTQIEQREAVWLQAHPMKKQP